MELMNKWIDKQKEKPRACYEYYEYIRDLKKYLHI
jgi:hypothetical protein